MRLFHRNITTNYFLHHLRRILFRGRVIYQASSPINGAISVTVVELDPGVISVAGGHFDVGSISHLTVIQGDALADMRRMRVDERMFDILTDDVFFNMTCVDTDPGDAEKHSSFSRQLKSPATEAEMRTVRGGWWNKIIYYRSRIS